MKLQEKVNATLPCDKYYYVTEEEILTKCLADDYIMLLVYDKDKLVAASFACKHGLFFERLITDWVKLEGNKIMCHEFVIVDIGYRGCDIQQRFMNATIREARAMGYDAIWCCAHHDNTPSVVSITKCGYMAIKQFVVNDCLGTYITEKYKSLT